MLKGYWKLAVRHLTRNAAHTVINVLGLGMALAMCIVAYLNYAYDRGYDAFHENGDAIYRINSVKAIGGEDQQWGISPLPLAEALREEVAGIKRITRLRNVSAVARQGERVFTERVTLADPDMLEMFTFPVSRGDPGVLRHHDRIALTQELAVKYFGDEDPLGRELALRFGDREERIFTVGAIMAPYPKNSSIQFGLLASIDTYLSLIDARPEDWTQWGPLTFVEVPEASDLAVLNARLAAYIDVQNAARPDWQIRRYYAEPLSRLAPLSRATRGHSLYANVPPSAVIGSAVTALLVLLMACFNFINLAVVSAGRRMKEIGVRKVMGGRRGQLIAQFMGESLLLCLLALVVSLGLAAILVPLYNGLWPEIALKLTFRDNAALFAFAGALVVITGLVAGTYPAIYASAFQPVSILRGAQRLSGPRPFTRALLGFQFALTIVGVAGTLVFAQNARYQETLEMGYAREALLGVTLDSPAAYASFRDEITQHPAVKHVAGSRSHIGMSWFSATARHADVEHEVGRFDVGDGYVQTTGMKIIEGRDFLEEETSSVLVNETLVRTFGWTEPIGQVISMDSLRYAVVGVVSDFHTNGVWRPIDPVVLRVVPQDVYTFAIVQVHPTSVREVSTYMEATWKRISPDEPYRGFAQDDVLTEGVAVSTSIRKMFSFIAFITLLIAGTGLFALVSLNIARRTKEIGIRKALGASALNIGHLINKEFVVLLGLAALVAAASGYYLFDLLLGSIYTYHVAVSSPPFLQATLVVLTLLLLSVGGKVYRAATANPVDAFRSE